MPNKPRKLPKNFGRNGKKVVVNDDADDIYNSSDDDDRYDSDQSGGKETDSDAESDVGSVTDSDEIDPQEELLDENAETEEENDEDEDEEDEEEVNEEVVEETDEGTDEVEGVEVTEDKDETFVGESKVCYMKNLDKDFIVLDEDDSNMYGKLEYKWVAPEDRESDPIMTYYEMVRIIGTRAQQFNFGALPLVKGVDGLHPAKMAYLELIAKMTPYIIRRRLPGKRYEEWRVDELDIIHKIKDEFFVPENFDLKTLTPNSTESSQTTTTKSK